MKNMSIKHTVVTATVLFGVVLGLVLVSAVVLLGRIETANLEQQKLANAVQTGKNIRFHVVQIQQFLTDVSATGDPAGFADASDHLGRVNDDVATLKSSHPDLRAQLDEVSVKARALHDVGVKMANAYMAKDGKAAGNLIMKAPDGFDNASLALAEASEKVVTALNTKLSAASDGLARSEKQASRIILVGLLVAFVLIIAVMILLYRKVVPPLGRLGTLFEAMSRGDLTGSIELKSSGDEISQMAVIFNKMSEDLRGVIGRVIATASQLAGSSQNLSIATGQVGQASSQVANAIQQVAHGATQQSMSVSAATTSVQHLSSAIDHVAQGAQEQSRSISDAAGLVQNVSSRISEIAGSADRVEAASRDAQATAQTGATAVRTAVDNMEKIKSVVDISAGKIRELGLRSKEIGEIIEVIDEIADQTNLLALNAAIEAARAGEHGKGFEVVAEEVRRLAERSSKATKEIAKLIVAIQKETSGAVASMQEATANVASGAETARQAGRALDEILAAVEGANNQVQLITAAVEEVHGNAVQLTDAMASISSVTEETTASAEEMSAASIEVVRLIGEVTAIVESNAAAAEEVSASAEELSASAGGMTAEARGTAESASLLLQLGSRFTVGDTSQYVNASSGQTRVGTLDFATAKTKHLLWKVRLRSFLDGKESLTEEQAVSHRDCDLGKWLYSKGLAEFGSLSEMREMERIHEDLHSTVKKIVRMKHAGNIAGAEAEFAKVEPISQKIIGLLDAVEKKVG